MSNSTWNTSDIPDQKGRVVIITGTTSGLGKAAATVFAGKNATVIMAVRNIEKAGKVANEIQGKYPGSDLKILELDLTSLVSIKSFSDAVKKTYDHLDLLINNAGIMMCPYSKTSDGFEIQMGTNHLGHFALTGHLFPLLKKTRDSRIVATSSLMHKIGNIDFSDINWEKRNYNTRKAYGDSKLANLLFVYELGRKLKDENRAPKVTAAHPGWTRTELQRYSGSFEFLNRFFAQDPDMGVLPTLRAAIDPEGETGDFYGPSGFMEAKGYPVKVKSNRRSHDIHSAGKLWDLSQELTGITY